MVCNSVKGSSSFTNDNGCPLCSQLAPLDINMTTSAEILAFSPCVLCVFMYMMYHATSKQEIETTGKDWR